MRYQNARAAVAGATCLLLLVLAGSGGGLAYAHEEDEEEEEAGNGQAGGGDITSVNAGTGLTGGGTSGDVTLNVDTAQIQQRVAGTCAPSNAIQTVKTDGTVDCVSPGAGTVTNVNTGAGLNGGPITTTGTISVAADGISSAMIQANAVTAAKIVDGAVSGGVGGKIQDGTIAAVDVNSGEIQTRLTPPTCPAGQVLQTINATGPPVCVALPSSSGGTVTQLDQGTGITLNPNPITNTGTIGVATGGITGALLAPDSVDSSKIVNGSVGSADLATNSVDSTKLAPDSVNSSKIVDATIAAVDVNPGEIQTRVAPPTCPAGQVLQTINATGPPVCVALPSSGGGTVTSLA